ncbi:MAG: hypothetical protein GTN49_07525, partial [candidate division Zixibacteria bacterium]|nr:hypothetical protein [candidate division Zixibacteria bacterium]
MKKTLLTIAAALSVCAGARAADVAADGGTSSAAPAFAARTSYGPGALELKWDNGRRRWSVIWYTGAGSWVGNDFDVSTLKTKYTKILKYKYYTRGAWPNGRWDGMRFAFYSFVGGVPASMLWPASGRPFFFKPKAGIEGHIWVEFDVNWNCPSLAFVAAQEQFYNSPNCDAFSLDHNATFMEHSWQFFAGQWAPFQSEPNIGPYRNVMVRVWVEPGIEFPGVAPSSIG